MALDEHLNQWHTSHNAARSLTKGRAFSIGEALGRAQVANRPAERHSERHILHMGKPDMAKKCKGRKGGGKKY